MPCADIAPLTSVDGSLQYRGVVVHDAAGDPAAALAAVLQTLGVDDLLPWVVARSVSLADSVAWQWALAPEQATVIAPGFDTLGLRERLHLDPRARASDLVREVVLGLLVGPVAFEFPSADEFVSAVRIRCNTVEAARKTCLAFHTAEAERPPQFWAWDDDVGFVIRPGVSLITALTWATQPEVSGGLYAFSCYRASEYVILLGIAQELERVNPALLRQLEALWQRRPIKSGEFHDVFLREQGSMEQPLPPRYFVAGDRTWFRNPDEASADASGFEGSWVMYLGGGRFSNFWKPGQSFSLQDKYLEIYHWRDAVFVDAEGEPRIDETKVEHLVQQTREDPAMVVRIEALMQRYREPRGVYTAAGGCIDTTREFARWVHPATADLVLPGV